MASIKTLGIVLRRVEYAEADRIFTFLTSDHGKLNAIAKSVRRLNSKLGSHLEPFNKIELMLVSGRELYIITGAKVNRGYSAIAEDYERLRRAWLFCEMIDKLTHPQVGRSLFELLDSGLEALNSGYPPALTELYFKLQLLDQLGYRPNLEQSLSARDEILSPKRFGFSPAEGKLVAPNASDWQISEIDKDHVKLWRLLLKYPPHKLAKVGGVERAATQSLPIANDFFDYLFGKRFRSEEI